MRGLKSIAKLGLAVLLITSNNPAFADTKNTGAGRKLYGQINAFGAACVSAGVTPLSTQLPTTVEAVQKGSPAFFAGVGVGDRILSASLEDNQFSLSLERNGHVYLAKMQARLDAKTPKNLPTGTSNLTLAALLKTYDIKLIIDHSGSMHKVVGNSDMSRWDWVKEMLPVFCSTVEALSHSRFDVCFFNESVQEEKEKTASDIARLLPELVTTGSTNLPQALRSTLTGTDKPLLLILLTDGQGVASGENANIIVSKFASSPALRRSKIVFIQTGYSEEGAQFIAALQTAMNKNGMKQGATMLLFEQVSKTGILKAIEPYLQQ